MGQSAHPLGLPVVIKVAWSGDVRDAASSARNLARAIGFPQEHCEEIHLVVVELATNLIRHAAHGTIRISPIDGEERAGIQIESQDDGPGITDVEQAITDGYSTREGLGLGLGTINRLMDNLEISSGPDGGLRVVCQRWIRSKLAATGGREIVFGAATRSHRLQIENGDAFIIKHWERQALVGIIDGLGHGPHARKAAQTARQYIEQHFDRPLEGIFRGADRACRATRGVVMALAHFDLVRQKVLIASTGNVEVRLLGGSERVNLMVRRGVIGLNAPAPMCTEHPWTESSLLVMHSDGLRSKWVWSDFNDVAEETPDMIARRMLVSLASPEDDATVLVGRNAGPANSVRSGSS